MDRVFAANVSTTAPATPGSVGYPSDGDPSAGKLPTIPGAYWFWMITAELLAVLTMGGVTAAGATLNQVATAISNIATSAASTAASAVQSTVLGWFTGSANQSLTTNGYQRLPGGYIEMWGQHTSTADSEIVTFPTMSGASAAGFPTACLNVMITLNEANPSSNDNPGATSLTATGFTAWAQTSERVFFWRAIGH